MIVAMKFEIEANPESPNWYIPKYHNEKDVCILTEAYNGYRNNRFRQMKPEDWNNLYSLPIVWVMKDGSVGVTMPQHPYGTNNDAWIDHIYKARNYFVGQDFIVIEY